MLFTFECPACSKGVEADSSLGGRLSECPHCGTSLAVPYTQVGPGTTVSGFRLEKLLGRGGMGEVFLAKQLSMGRHVAVKILPRAFAENKDAVTRFLHEVHTSAKLDHPNIVSAIEAGNDDGVLFLAMGYVDGLSLDRRLKQDGPLPEAEALDVVRTVADALDYAWDEFQLLHRDIKPANIMIDRRNRIQLMDLGLAKSLGEESALTVSGAVLGTPHYMSPEQARGMADLDVRSDIYSLGATLYHLVTGTTPFPGDSALNIMAKHLSEPLPPPRERNPNVSETCAHLIECMMAKTREARPGSWQEVIRLIDAARSGAVPGQDRAAHASLARQAQEALSRQHRAAAGKKAKPKTAEATKADAQPPGRRKRIVAVAALVATLLIVIGIVVATRRGKTERTAATAAAGTQQKAARRADATQQTASAAPAENTAGGAGTDAEKDTPTAAEPEPEPQAQEEAPAAPPEPAERPAWDRITLPHTGDWALEFDGKDDYVVIPSLKYDGSHPITLEIVVSVSGDDPVVIAGSDEGTGIRVIYRDGAFHMRAGKTDMTPCGRQYLGKRAVHLAGMWDGKRKQLYLNGIHVGTTEPPPFTVDKPAPIALGVCADTTGKPKANFLKGRIQCVRITKGIRFTTDFELESALPMRKDSDTLCLLDFEEGEGDVAKDLSGNGHDGQIHGANWKRMWPCPVEEKKLREVEEALRKANSGADHLRLRASGFPGGMHLSVGAPGPEMKKIHDIRSLSGLPIRSLTLSATGVSDITPLAGMSLVVLFMRDTPVSDLSAIKGCPLVVLDAKGTKISDLDPLRGMPLRFLHLLYCRGVKNLEPLSGMPLQHLCVTGASVTDISVLAGMPLRSLGPSDNTMDFTPLASCPSLELVPPWTIPEDQLAFIKKSLPKTAFSLDIALWNGVVYGRVLPDIMADLLRGLPDAGKHSDSSTPRNDLAAFLLVGEYSKAAAIADGDDSLAAAVCAMPQRILDSFRADVGKTGEIRLKKETLTCEIREVNGDAISVFEVVKRGNTTGKIGRTIRYDELSVQEKLRRLGSGDNPELNIMRGLLAAEAERPDIARKLFEKTDGPLAEALIAELHKQEVEGADAAADRAGRDLLRTIARSTAATSRDSIIAEIRAKCEASPGNVNQARKLLAAYEEDYGETEAGKRWISVVRDALTYPWPGEDWTVPDLGMEFVWIEPMNMWVGKYEVTNGEYRKFRPRHNTGMAPASCSLNADRQPVANVRQPEAETFAALLDTCEGEAGRRPEGCGYRLPTSREFLHYVACGDKVPKYPWGNTWPPERTNLAGAEAAETKNNHLVRTIDGYRDEFPVSAPVDRTEPNAWGICGLAGNVAEWMAREKNTARCMYRGACWASGFRKKGEGDLRTGDLYCPAEETYRAQTIGFRLVLAPALGGDK